MRPAVAVLVLGQLESQLLVILAGVPAADRLAQAAPPTAQPVRVSGEVQQVGSSAGHARQGSQRQPASLGVFGCASQRQREDGRVGLVGPPVLRDVQNRLDKPAAVFRQAAQGVLGVVEREGLLGDVIRAAFGAQHQEAHQALPRVELPGVPAGRVRDLVGTRDRRELRGRLAVEQVVDLGHGFLLLARMTG